MSPIKSLKNDSPKIYNQIFHNNNKESNLRLSTSLKIPLIKKSKENYDDSVNSSRLFKTYKEYQIQCPKCKMNIDIIGNSRYITCNSPFCKESKINFCSLCKSLVIPLDKDKHFENGEYSPYCINKSK